MAATKDQRLRAYITMSLDLAGPCDPPHVETELLEEDMLPLLQKAGDVTTNTGSRGPVPHRQRFTLNLAATDFGILTHFCCGMGDGELHDGEGGISGRPDGEGDISGLPDGEGDISGLVEGAIPGLHDGEGGISGRPDGEGDISPDGEGDISPDGEGDISPDGEGDMSPDGEGDVSPPEKALV